MDIRNDSLRAVFPAGTASHASFTLEELTGDSVELDVRPDQLIALLEASTWVSGFNAHPWRFVYATRNSPQWDLFIRLARRTNPEAVSAAAVIVMVVAPKLDKTARDEKGGNLFHAGPVWQNILCSAQRVGVQVLKIGGYSGRESNGFEDAGVPQNYKVVSMLAVIGNTPRLIEARSERSPRGETFVQ